MAHSVYEYINWTRQEHLVLLSTLDEKALAERLRSTPPAEAASWGGADRLTLECVARDMPEADARVFLDNYASALRIPGWKMLVVRGY